MLYCRQANWLMKRQTMAILFIEYGLIDQAQGQNEPAQKSWVLYGQASRAISTG
jgi:hypothetical protein